MNYLNLFHLHSDLVNLNLNTLLRTFKNLNSEISLKFLFHQNFAIYFYLKNLIKLD